ncbi:hypothetical protein IQ782_12625 [Salipiger pacificus]|uniref:Uncharacterized protein n=1 Tax=Salipiger mangrovisoli TaxID=2865933 RepID=A0ABR9X2A7_9RHOB|nr:hypothetical protein [Salipiger mangrovisoli]
MLAPFEKAGLDPQPLEAIFARLGPSEAENALCRAMEELAYRLGELDRVHAEGRWSDTRRHVRELGGIADCLGMSSVVRISEDVLTCLEDGDLVALSATVARLGRVGERSLYAIWDMEDQGV